MSVIEKFYEKERALEVLVVSLVCVDNILHLPEKDSIHNILTNIAVSLSENKSLGTRVFFSKHCQISTSTQSTIQSSIWRFVPQSGKGGGSGVYKMTF